MLMLRASCLLLSPWLLSTLHQCSCNGPLLPSTTLCTDTHKRSALYSLYVHYTLLGSAIGRVSPPTSAAHAHTKGPGAASYESAVTVKVFKTDLANFTSRPIRINSYDPYINRCSGRIRILNKKRGLGNRGLSPTTKHSLNIIH